MIFLGLRKVMCIRVRGLCFFFLGAEGVQFRTRLLSVGKATTTTVQLLATPAKVCFPFVGAMFSSESLQWDLARHPVICFLRECFGHAADFIVLFKDGSSPWADVTSARMPARG